MLSIGIDDYGNTKWQNSKSDAVSYVKFFKSQFYKMTGPVPDTLFYSYTLLDKDATKDSILKVLKEIASRASSNDYFIFNFSILNLEDSIIYNITTISFFDLLSSIFLSSNCLPSVT